MQVIKIPQILDFVVKNDMCTGCGVCISTCPNSAIEMNWNDYGFLVPILKGVCDSHGECLLVCPFNPFPSIECASETEIAQKFFDLTSKNNNKIGFYKNFYAGFSIEFRNTSTSGGIATFILSELFNRGIIDSVCSVRASSKSGYFYEYSLINSIEDLIRSSKTRYYPVTLAEVFSAIKNLDKRVAIVGVGCFVKAVRLAQMNNPTLIKKIPFIVGIICGGLKSAFFTEYLGEKAGVSIVDIQEPQYRIKNIKSTADNYSFECINKEKQQKNIINMKSVGNMWGTGLFKSNACDFCDDVTTELADISLGDIWIEPYKSDGQGTNVMVTRTELAEDIIKESIKNGAISAEKITLDQFLKTQQGSFNHRHRGQAFRLQYLKKKGVLISKKRYENEKISLDFKIVQLIRMFVRKKSLEIWKECKNAISFDKKIKIYLVFLRIATKFYHFKLRLTKNEK